MRDRRGLADERLLCSGPGRLCQALAVTREFNGLRLDAPPFELTLAPAVQPVVQGRRIGISRAVDVPWRFALADSRYLSRPLR